MAYTTGSVWSTLEVHGNYSVGELKHHCNIHLVFLEGGILGQLHKKPTIPRLMGIPVKGTEPCVVVIDAITSDNAQTGQVTSCVKNTPAQTVKLHNNEIDHTYAPPPLQICNVAISNPVESAQNQEHQQQHDDHTYAELSDVPIEPYGSESDSQDKVVTTGGKFIISRSDKVEINLEYQCSTSLPEATKDGNKPTILAKTLSDNATTNLPDVTKEFPDETMPTSLSNVLLDGMDQNYALLPDETKSSNNVLPDKTYSTDTPVLSSQRVISSSSDVYQP